MNTKAILVAVLAAFSALNVLALAEHGIVGLFERVFDNSATVLAMVDLSIALTLVMVWMWQDARKRGVSAIPYCAVTVVAGSIGPLLYLLFRPSAPAA